MKGDGEIDIEGAITAHPCAYLVCTMHEIHEAFDTLAVRPGGVSNDTFICFTSRSPVIFFEKERLPKTSHNVVVKFDTWTAYRAGAMFYRNSANQWILTTGLSLESVVLIRDHVGNCYDPATMNTLVWHFLPIAPEEPLDPIAEMVTAGCVMPSSERWHCTLTTKEKETSAELHIFDGPSYLPIWGEEKVSLRQSDSAPPDKALAQAEWVGSKIKQLATMAPQHVADKQEQPRQWKFNPLGLSYMGSSQSAENRSRTPQDAKIRARVVRKGWVQVKRERSLERVSIQREKKRTDG